MKQWLGLNGAGYQYGNKTGATIVPGNNRSTNLSVP